MYQQGSILRGGWFGGRTRNASAGRSGYQGSAVTSGYTRQTWYDPKGIEEMLSIMHGVEQQRLKLACKGGDADDIRKLTGLLRHEFTLTGRNSLDGKAGTAHLADPQGVKRALWAAGQLDLHFEVRRTHYGLPMYYLARTHHDWWGAYGLIVEDLFLSDGYPVDDPRFVKLTRAGRGQYFLRLSPFRESVADMDGLEDRDGIDDLFYRLGRCALQGAWHTDQRFSFMVAEAFGMPQLKAAIELVYMCLSVDLCALRTHLTEHVPRFFTEVYPNPALVRLIHRLPGMNGQTINELSHTALEAYRQIARHFNRFLTTEVAWQGIEKTQVPLWKLMLANMKRLETLARYLEEDATFQQARSTLLEEAEAASEYALAA